MKDLGLKILATVLSAALLGTFSYVWRTHDLLARLEERDKARMESQQKLADELRRTQDDLRGVTQLFTDWIVQHGG